MSSKGATYRAEADGVRDADVLKVVEKSVR